MSTQVDQPQDERWHQVDAYLESHLTARDEEGTRVLAAQHAAGLPDIALSSVEAKLLEVLARSIGARTVVEFGTLGGYSTLHLARALPADGELITIERDERHAQVARASLDAAGVGHKVTIRIGTCLEMIPSLADHAPVDMVFIDADKRNNVAYYEAAIAISRPGALIVVDNVVRRGAIVDAGDTTDDTEGTRAVIELAGRDPRVEATVIQTVGRKGHDGMLIATVV